MPDATSTPEREPAQLDAVGTATLARPLRTVVMVAVTAVLVGILVLAAPLRGVVAAVVCAVGVLVSHRFVATTGWQTASSALVALLLLLVGSGFAYAIGYTLLELIGVLFPVSTVSLIQPLGLEAVAATATVAIGTVGLVGSLTTLGGGTRPESLERMGSNGRTAARVTGGVSVGMLLATALLRNPAEPVPAVDPIVPLLDAILDPAPNEIHLFSFAGLVVGTGLVIGSEFVARRGTTDGPANVASAVGATRPGAVLSGPRVALGTIVAFAGLEVLVPPSRIAPALPDWLATTLRGLTASSSLRYAVVALLVVTVLLAGVRRLERRAEAVVDGEDVTFLFPIVGGLVVVLSTVLGHGFVLEPLLAGVQQRLPQAYGMEFADRTAELVGFYGPLALALVLATAAVWLGSAIASAIALVDRAVAIPDPGVAPVLATTGLFGAAAVAVGVGISPPVVLGGVFVAVVGWDVLLFEERIHREGGETAFLHRPTAVHALGSTLVGGLGLAGALLAFEYAPEAPAAASETVSFALFVALVGIASLVVLVRR